MDFYFRFYDNYCFQRSGNIGPEPKWMIWAEMTDRFGGTWALIDTALYFSHRETNSNTLRICSMKCLTEKRPIEFSDQSDCYQSDSDQSDFDLSDFDSDPSDFDSDSGTSDFDSDSDPSDFDSDSDISDSD